MAVSNNDGEGSYPPRGNSLDHDLRDVERRVLRLEVEVSRDRAGTAQHIADNTIIFREMAAQRASDWDRARVERAADREKTDKERDEIKALLADNTRAIHDANLAGKILIKAVMIVAATPAIAYTIVKIVQEFFPPKTPLHAVIFSAIASSMLFAATPALANYVDAVASVVYVPSCSSPTRLWPASRWPIFFGESHASLGSNPGCPGWLDNR